MIKEKYRFFVELVGKRKIKKPAKNLKPVLKKLATFVSKEWSFKRGSWERTKLIYPGKEFLFYESILLIPRKST